MKWVVYLIMDVAGDACYVGKTNDMKKRWREHVNAAKRGCHTLLARALAKAIRHDEARFDYSVLSEHLSEDEAFAVEQFWIDRFELNALRHSDGCGLNMTDGGEGRSGYVMSAWSRSKISNSLKTIRSHRKYALCFVLSSWVLLDILLKNIVQISKLTSTIDGSTMFLLAR